MKLKVFPTDVTYRPATSNNLLMIAYSSFDRKTVAICIPICLSIIPLEHVLSRWPALINLVLS